MISLEKIRGSHNYRISYHDKEMSKLITWQIEPDDISLDTLRNIIHTVEVEEYLPITPTTPAIPREWPAELIPEQWATVSPFIPPATNQGAEAADKAAREEEMRLRNMGSALGQGINLSAEDIPVVDADASGHVHSDLPDVNWGV